MLLATLLFNTRWSRNWQSIITLVTTNRSSVHWSRIKNLKRRPLLFIFLLLLRGPQREPGVSWHDHQSWGFSSWSLSQSSNMVITSNIVFYIIRIYVSPYCYQAGQRSIHQEKGEEAALALRPKSEQGGWYTEADPKMSIFRCGNWPLSISPWAPPNPSVPQNWGPGG